MIWGINRFELERIVSHKVGDTVGFDVKTGINGQYGRVLGKVVARDSYTRITLSGRVSEGTVLLIKPAANSPDFSAWNYMAVFVPESWGMQGGIDATITNEIAGKYLAEQDALVSQCMAL